MLYICTASRRVIFNLPPHLDSHAFIRGFLQFVARCGCPNNVISDGGRNFVSDATQTFIHRFGVDWRVNLNRGMVGFLRGWFAV